MQLPYIDRFETIWEYEKLFLSGQIDFCPSIGERCPICGGKDCYRAMAPYWRYAIELFPEFKKKRIPIARFLCRQRQKTFFLLPIQLIPYFQYMVGAVVETLLLGMGCWQMGQKGFHGTLETMDPESLATPWLISCWLVAVLRGLGRNHAVLRQVYGLDILRSQEKAKGWEEVAGYFAANAFLNSHPTLKGIDSNSLFLSIITDMSDNKLINRFLIDRNDLERLKREIESKYEKLLSFLNKFKRNPLCAGQRELMSSAWGSLLKARTVGCEGDKDTICARGFTICYKPSFFQPLKMFGFDFHTFPLLDLGRMKTAG